MKKVVHTICIFLSLAFAFVAVTFCWFSRGELLNFRDDFGSAKASYFGGGDGSSEENAYVISSSTHFYNLAWLQYLGYFNAAGGANNGRLQSYFKLTKNIDMSELQRNGTVSALPPIGTEQYPFIGNFDGNGYKIDNVFVSNLMSDLIVRPTTYKTATDDNKNEVLAVYGTTGTTTKAVNIVGLFGVTGDYGVSADANGVVSGSTAYMDKFKDSLSSPTAATASGEDEVYYGVMKVENLYTDNLSVKSASSKTLVGLAAGYASASLNNVGVYRCSITVNAGATGLSDSAPLSNYSLLGDYNNAVITWSEKPSSGGGSGDQSGWGGSIDMRTLNRRLNYLYTAGKTGTNNYWQEYSNDKSDANGGNDFFLITRYAANSGWGTDYLREYYWKADYDCTMYIMSDTILPLNIDTYAMGLTLENGKRNDDETVNESFESFHYNSVYSTNKTETIAKSNTGYIVGGGGNATETRSKATIRAGIRLFASNAYSGGIYESFKGAAKGDSITYTISDKEDNNTTDKIFALYTLKGSGDNWTTYRIVDTKNEKNYDTDSYNEVSNKRFNSDELSFVRYEDVRDNFDNAMQDAITYHGFHFVPYIPAGTTKRSNLNSYIVEKDVTISNNSMSGYELLKGGLNFTVDKAGYITTIVSGGYTQSAHTLFSLYEVDREETNPCKIKSIKQIYKIYQKTGADGQTEYSYTYSKDETLDGTLVFDIGSLSASDYLTKAAAYYFEIPVNAGDYVIGSAKGSSDSSGYLSYLDIGANGSSGGGSGSDKKPMNITTVDFVNNTTDKEFSTAYADVTAQLNQSGSGASTITIKRLQGSSVNEKGEVNTPVYYTVVSFDIKNITFSPGSLVTTTDTDPKETDS